MDTVIKADLNQPLVSTENNAAEEDQGGNWREAFASKLWVETQQLWLIVGPTIFARVATFSMKVITQVFPGHLGDVQLASISIANTLIVGFNFGLLLGMASALEELCGQAY